MEAANDNTYFRVQEIGVSSVQNSAINRSIVKPTRYYALVSPYISNFLDEMYYNVTLNYSVAGSGNRSILDALTSVKYYIVKEGSEDKLPFNYENLAAKAETYDGIALACRADVSSILVVDAFTHCYYDMAS